MTDRNENTPSRLKASVVAVLIVTACGAIAYNAVFLQNPAYKRPGSTALRVEVRDTDLEGDDNAKNLSSIGQLVKNTQTGEISAAERQLVVNIQKGLTALGFYAGEIDGKSGPKTAAAIRLYQNQNGLPANGAVSTRLYEHIKFTRKITQAAKTTGSVPASGTLIFSVRDLQEKLLMFGYDPGKPDGKMGASTLRALKKFQADRSLPVTGRVSSTILSELDLL